MEAGISIQTERSYDRILCEILSALGSDGIDYALIHGDVGRPVVASDVDLAVAGNPLRVVEPILRRLQEAGKLTVVQRLHYDVPHGYYYVLAAPDLNGPFLQLDCLHDAWGINRYHLSTRFLLEGKKAEPWGFRVADDREALYLLIKRTTKGQIPQQGFDQLRRSFDASGDALWAEIDRWFGKRGRPLVERLLRPSSATGKVEHLRELRQHLKIRFRLLHPFRFLAAAALTAWRRLERFLTPTGLFAVILGPDGSGKSAVSELALERSRRAFRKTWHFHWRPGLLPKLGRAAAAAVDGKSRTEAPPEVSRYRGLVSLARFVYYWCDFMVGYWTIVYPRKAQTGLVLAERYFPDVLVHPARYGFAVPRWMLRLAARLVPSPDLVVLLKGDPDVIHARKPELSPNIIAEQIAAYEKEIRRWGRWEVLVVEEGADAVAERLSRLIIQERAALTARRLGWS